MTCLLKARDSRERMEKEEGLLPGLGRRCVCSDTCERRNEDVFERIGCSPSATAERQGGATGASQSRP